MREAIVERFALGAPPWPTIDPFLFCVHHLDAYPAGDGALAPVAALVGRQIGSDFAGIDGWNMYHGQRVPGFPQHPHRGFETVTFVRRGFVDHADSLGATARYGQGDVQWLTAGAGIVHAEMFPLLATDRPNPTELFQIWLNLPRADKMAEPHFSMLWAEDIPTIERIDASGNVSRITVIAGAFGTETPRPPAPPPNSYASQAAADVALWHVQLDDGARVNLPSAANAESVRVLYLFVGDVLGIDGETLAGRHGAVVRCDQEVELVATSGAIEALIMQGRPIGEPVAQYGPFVLNDRAGVMQAFDDYQRTRFGGWPWATDDPTNGHEAERFARRPDGTLERPPGRSNIAAVHA